MVIGNPVADSEALLPVGDADDVLWVETAQAAIFNPDLRPVNIGAVVSTHAVCMTADPAHLTFLQHTAGGVGRVLAGDVAMLDLKVPMVEMAVVAVVADTETLQPQERRNGQHLKG